jgi:HEAT repeat protein
MNDLEMKYLVHMLGSSKLGERKKARAALISAGAAVVPALAELLSDHSSDLRWEAVFVLGEMKIPATAPLLIKALEDEVLEVRWRASVGLIALKRNSLVPLFKALKDCFESVLLREGAHHVLRGLDKEGVLAEPSLKVLEALESVEPVITVPWAAERALEAYQEADVSAPKQLPGKDIEEDFLLHMLDENPRFDEE